MDQRDAWMQQLGGKFLVFDGPDGSGKTTQFRRLVDQAKSIGLEVCEVREPGGTFIGEEIRDVLLEVRERGGEQMDLRCEMLLFMASRAQLVAERIGPAIAAGQLVLADRFISSTLAYQGTAGGIPVQDIVSVGEIALGRYWPDLVVVFDVDEATAASRLNPLLDRMEQKGAAFHRRVRQGYLDQAADDPTRYAVVDAREDEDTVYDNMLESVRSKLGLTPA